MKRERPTIDNGAGPKRQKRYAKAIDRYNEAKNGGYFVECIAIAESLIGDRLESISNQISGGKMSYQPLGQLVHFLQKQVTKASFDTDFVDILNQIGLWTQKRNFAVHELAKLTPNMKESFEESYNKLKSIADDGMSLFREIDKQIRKYRKSNP